MSKYDELKRLAEEVQMSAAGTWTLQTGCSWRRIGNEFGDGNVLRPCAHQDDGWPDLSAAPYVLEYLIAAQPSAILELIAENERLRNAIAGLLEWVAPIAGDNQDDEASQRELDSVRVAEAAMQEAAK